MVADHIKNNKQTIDLLKFILSFDLINNFTTFASTNCNRSVTSIKPYIITWIAKSHIYHFAIFNTQGANSE